MATFEDDWKQKKARTTLAGGPTPKTAEQKKTITDKMWDEWTKNTREGKQAKLDAEMEKAAADQAEIAKMALEEQISFNNWQRQQLEIERAARNKEQADAAAREKEEEERVKNRGRRRLTLIKTEQQDENILGNTTVGRSRVLGN